MTRKMSGQDSGRSGPDGAGASEYGDQDEGKPALRRRALLTRGGVVAAGVVGAGVAAAAAAGPASAAVGDPVLQGDVNGGTTLTTPTELDAVINTAPTFILNNTGVVPATSTTPAEAGPTLRLTPSTALVPASTVGGDLTATADGTLWFTTNFGTVASPAIFPAPVHTDVNANVYAPLAAPNRILDTRTVAGRAHIIKASGNLDSAGRLLKGHTIYIDLDSLVFFAEAVFANITVTGMAGSGFLTVWPGNVARPPTSTINFTTVTIANFLVSGVATPPTTISTTVVNAIAIYASQTTQVILDVAGFSLPGFEYAIAPLAGANAGARAARLQRAQARMGNA
jgi:hypothetical protein